MREYKPSDNMVNKFYAHGFQVDDEAVYVPWGEIIARVEDDHAGNALQVAEGSREEVRLSEARTARERDDFLSPTRDYLRGLNSWQRDILNRFLNAADVPEILRPDRSPGSTADWAAHLVQAPDEQLINFWQWQAYHMEELNDDPEFKEKVAHTNRDYGQKVRDQVEAGIMPKSAIEALGRVEEAHVMVGDVFDLNMNRVLGYCYRKTSTIVLDQHYDPDVHIHEMNHLLGALPIESLDEAVVEHVTLGIQQGNFATVDPDARAEPSGSYSDKRKLLAALMTRGRWMVPLESVLEAYIEDDKHGPAAQRLGDQINTSFGGIDMEAYIKRQRASMKDQLETRFPEATAGEITEGADRFAVHAVEGLTEVVYSDSVRRKIKKINAEAKDARRHARQLKKDDTADTFTQRNAEVNAYVLQLYSEKLRKGELE